jgi:uncharacterized membrane protein YesL
MRGFMGGLYRISEWIMRLSVINVLWIICSLPIFVLLFLGLVTSQVDNVNTSNTQSIDSFLAIIPLVLILTPFTLFPATTAMFAVARKWIMGDEDVPLFKTFFRAYRENYLQSMIGGIIFVLLITVLIANFRFYQSQTGIFKNLTIFIFLTSVILVTAMLNFFSIIVHLHMKIFQIVKNAFLFAIANPINTILQLVINGVILYVSLFQFTFLIPFFMGSLVATFSFWRFYLGFQKIQLKQQQLLENEHQQSENQSTENQSTENQSTNSQQQDYVFKSQVENKN